MPYNIYFSIFLLASLVSSQSLAHKCNFMLTTSQNENIAPLEITPLTFNTPGLLESLFSTSKYSHILDNSDSVPRLMQNIETALLNAKIPTQYDFFPKGWDDRGKSLYIESPITIKHTMANGLKIYLFKTSDGHVHLFAEAINPKTLDKEIHSVGNASFLRALKVWAEKNKLALSNVDSIVGKKIVNIDDYGTKGVVEIVNHFLMTYNQLSGLGVDNSHRIDIVKAAYRYALDQKRKERLRFNLSAGEHVQYAIDKAVELYNSSSMTRSEVADFLYEMLTLDISVDVMDKLYNATKKTVSGLKLHYVLFLNSMLSDIKLRTLNGEKIQINLSNYEQYLAEYREKYKVTENMFKLLDQGYVPFVFTFGILKGGNFIQNTEHAKAVVKQINKVVSNSKVSGSLLLVALNLKVDNSPTGVLRIANGYQDIHTNTLNDVGGSILLSEVLEREEINVSALASETNYLWDNTRLATDTTIGEAIYLARKMKFSNGQIKQSIDEVYSRVNKSTHIDAQGVIDLLEIFRLKMEIENTLSPEKNSLGETVGLAESEIQEIKNNTIAETIEETTNSAVTMAMMAAIVGFLN